VVGAAERLERGGLFASRLNLFVSAAELARAPSEVKIRYRHPGATAQVRSESQRLHVRFDRPQRGIAPGQSCVIYRDELLLGGGRIEAACECCAPTG
jgi:tRNA-uridine 2-sulfurtransferase